MYVHVCVCVHVSTYVMYAHTICTYVHVCVCVHVSTCVVCVHVHKKNVESY